MRKKTLRIEFDLPKDGLCIECGKKIDVMLYIGRKIEMRNKKCLDCTKRDIALEKLEKKEDDPYYGIEPTEI